MGGGASLEEIDPWGWALRFLQPGLTSWSLSFLSVDTMNVTSTAMTSCHIYYIWLGISHSGKQGTNTETNGSLCETKEDSLRKAFKLRIEGKLKRNTEHRERTDQDLTKSLENQKEGLEKSSKGGCEGKSEPDATAVGMCES